MTRAVRILREPDVRASLPMRQLVDAVERAFAAASTGRAEVPAVISLEVPEALGEVHVKAGHLHGAPAYAVKVASGFAAADPPAVDGLVLVFDARDGSLAAVLLDDGYVTEARTAAAGGVVARHLARDGAGTVAVLGTGAQARAQVAALALVRELREVRVWGRSPERAERCAVDLRASGALPGSATVTVARSVEAAVDRADVVVTCTASREPILRAAWLAPGAHVTALGSDGADKQELEPDVLANADLVVVDSRRQCAQIGELHHALDARLIASPDDAVELGEICAGLHPGRTDAGQLTVCDLTGLGVQDVAAAALALERAGDRGTTVEP